MSFVLRQFENSLIAHIFLCQMAVSIAINKTGMMLQIAVAHSFLISIMTQTYTYGTSATITTG